MKGPGHNSGIAADRLRSFVERIERLSEEAKAINGDKAEVFKEAKGEGYCTKTMKLVIARRARNEHDVVEQDELLDVYLRALGMQDATRAGAGGDA